MITRFRGEYFFLSNFYEGEKFIYNGMEYTNAECAFQSQKNPSKKQLFEGLRPSDAKKLGRVIDLREDWESVKDSIMFEVCYAKFYQSKELTRLLLSTGDDYLMEGNFHGDRYWGKTYSQKYGQWIGENKLGTILMKVRSKLKEEYNAS